MGVVRKCLNEDYGVSKAFESVNHNCLDRRMKALEVRGGANTWARSSQEKRVWRWGWKIQGSPTGGVKWYPTGTKKRTLPYNRQQTGKQ